MTWTISSKDMGKPLIEWTMRVHVADVTLVWKHLNSSAYRANYFSQEREIQILLKIHPFEFSRTEEVAFTMTVKINEQ